MFRVILSISVLSFVLCCLNGLWLKKKLQESKTNYVTFRHVIRHRLSRRGEGEGTGMLHEN